VGAPPFAIAGINHLLLLVNGMERSLAFYESLGCIVESRIPKYGMVELRAGASCLDLVDIDSREGAWANPKIAGGRNVDHVAIGIHSGNEAALRKYLASNGVAVVEERVEETADGSALSLYVRDPSGNTIELISI
jgi:catechol 2,3-dioxygenase-like lactoylglutathione lyase family enzyme